MTTQEAGQRYFSGYIDHIKAGRITSKGQRHYHIRLVPWFSLMDSQQHSRVFQQKTVMEIFQSLCQADGFDQFDLSGIQQNHPPIDYVVQYNETDFAFLNRL